MMTKAVADIHKLSKQEKKSKLPSVAPRWNKPFITAFMSLKTCKRPSKDERVDYISKVLQIGATNTLDVCKNFILAALPKLRIGFLSFLYQRVAIGKSSVHYQALDYLALFTAIYLQAEADKKTKCQRFKYQALKAQRTGCNPYKDFLAQPDIKEFTKAEERGYLLSLSEVLCDPEILCGLPGLASRDIRLPCEKRSDVENKKITNAH
jgi:hypothetical protein